MFCPRCGANNVDGTRFCYSCGNPLPQTGDFQPAAASTNASPAPRQPQTGRGAGSPARPAHAAQPSGKRSRRKRSKKPFVIIACVLGALLVAGGGFFLYGKMSGSSNANIAKIGIVEEYRKQNVKDGAFKGFVSTEYVDDEAFRLDSCDVTASEGFLSHVSGELAVKARNSFFDTTATVSYSGTISNGLLTGVTFKTEDQKSTARRGITHDEEHGVPANSQSQLSEDGKSCTVEAIVEDEGDGPTWFQKAAHKETLTYTFDGSGWKYESSKKGEATTIFAPPTNTTFSTSNGQLDIRFESTGDAVEGGSGAYESDAKVVGSGMTDAFEIKVDCSDVPMINEYGDSEGGVVGTTSFTANPLEDLGNGALGIEVVITSADAPGREDGDAGYHFYVVFNQSQPDTLDIYRANDSDTWPINVRDLSTYTLYWPARTPLDDSLDKIKTATAGKETPDLTVSQDY